MIFTPHIFFSFFHFRFQNWNLDIWHKPCSWSDPGISWQIFLISQSTISCCLVHTFPQFLNIKNFLMNDHYLHNHVQTWWQAFKSLPISPDSAHPYLASPHTERVALERSQLTQCLIYSKCLIHSISFSYHVTAFILEGTASFCNCSFIYLFNQHVLEHYSRHKGYASKSFFLN